MYITWRVTPLVAVGVVPVIAVSVAGVDAWAAAAGWIVVCVLLTLVDVLLAPNPKDVRVRRDVPARVRRGTPVQAGLELTSPRRRMRVRIRDAWQPTAGAPAGRIAVTLPAGRPVAVATPLRPRRRGELVSPFVAVRSAGPLRLAGRQGRHEVPAAIRVLPPFVSARHLPSRLARLHELTGPTSTLLRGQGTEFDSLRPYVRGDDVRSIDWRATARAGETMLRTWRPERDRHVVIVIDTGRTAAARVGDAVRLDAQFEAALLLSALAAEAGDHVHLVLFDRVARARVTGVDGQALVPAMVDAMAPVHPQLIDTDWDAAFAQVRALAVRPSLLVVLTAQDEPEASRAFLGSLPTLTGRAGTHVLVGTVRDVGLTERARARANAAEIYAAAAAEQTIADADRVAAAIERAGAGAISDGPDDLPVRIADRYLELKAAGRL